MADQARLVVTRDSPDDAKQRQVIIKLDGKWIGDLLYGKSLTRTIEAGEHTIRFDNTWNKKTLQFKVEPGEEVKFKTVNRLGRFTWFLVAALGAGPMYVSAERAD